MFAPPKKRTGMQPPKKRQGTERKVDVKALVKDFSNSYRQLDDYVTKENEDKKNWNQHSPDKITSRKKNESTADKNGKQSNAETSATSSFTSKGVDSLAVTKSLRKSENIYADDMTVTERNDQSPIPEDMHSLLDAYPKKFQELRKIMEEMKERHAKSINRMRQKLKKDALKKEEEVREAAKKDAQVEAEKLRHILKVQRAKSQRAMESMKLEKQKLVNNQAKSNKALRQTENKLADMQKGLFTMKKQLAKSQRERAVSEQGRVELRSKAVKEKKRADELQRDIKSLESGIETVRLLNRQNENVTQHDYDVLHWKFQSIVKLVREVESIATPPHLGKTPSLQTIIQGRHGRGSRVRLPAIGYPRRLPIKGDQRAFNGRGQKRQVVYPQKKVVHQIPRRNNQNETRAQSNEKEMLALPMPEKKIQHDHRDSSTTDSTSTDSIDEKQNSRNQNEMLALPMPETSTNDSRESSSTRRSASDSTSIQQAHSPTSQQSAKSRSSRVQSTDSDTEKEKSDDVTFNDSFDNMKDEQKSRSHTEEREDKGADEKEENVGVFLT